MRVCVNILVSAVVMAALSAPALAADDTAAVRKPAAGSIAEQLRLKLKLKAISKGDGLVAAINHNRNEWEQLSPDQRDEYRRNVVAFLNKSPEDQEKLLKHYDKLVKLSPVKRQEYRERAKWVNAVSDNLSETEKTELLTLSPQERARKLIERRDELIQQGKLKLAEPASRPTTAPATAPALGS